MRNQLSTMPMHITPSVQAIREKEEVERALIGAYLTRHEDLMWEHGGLEATKISMRTLAGLDRTPPRTPAVPPRYRITFGGCEIYTTESMADAGTRFTQLVSLCRL